MGIKSLGVNVIHGEKVNWAVEAVLIFVDFNDCDLRLQVLLTLATHSL